MLMIARNSWPILQWIQPIHLKIQWLYFNFNAKIILMASNDTFNFVAYAYSQLNQSSIIKNV